MGYVLGRSSLTFLGLNICLISTSPSPSVIYLSTPLGFSTLYWRKHLPTVDGLKFYVRRYLTVDGNNFLMLRLKVTSDAKRK